MYKCKICKSIKFTELIDLGDCPLAGAFLKEKEDKSEIFPLKIYFCHECISAQVLNPISPDKLFGIYHYSSSQINDLSSHFKKYYKELITILRARKNSSFLDIGCNDGVLIKNFINDSNVNVIGVDPSFEEYEIKNIKTFKRFFNEITGLDLLKTNGKFDIINASNVFAHISDLNAVFKTMVNLIKDDGLIKIEVHSLNELIKYSQYDTIYHEHIYYHSLSSLSSFAKRHDVYIVDIEFLKTHGGSLRVTYSKAKPEKTKYNELDLIIKNEKKLILNSINSFKNNTIQHINSLTNLIEIFKQSNLKIGAYGASGRGVMFLNQIFKNNQNELRIIIDDSEARIGLILPLLKTSIVDSNWLINNKIDIIIISAWNYSETIIEKLRKIKYKGYILIPFPILKITYLD